MTEVDELKQDILNEVGNPKNPSAFMANRVEACLLVSIDYFAEVVEDTIHLIEFSFGTLGCVHVWNMDDRFLCRVEYFHNRVEVAAAIKMVADAKTLEISVAV